MICCQTLKYKYKERSSEKKPKYLFQRQSKGLEYWFKLDSDCIKEKFMTREPYFLKSFIKKIL